MDELKEVLTANNQRLAYRPSRRGDPTHIVPDLDTNPLARALCNVDQAYGWQSRMYPEAGDLITFAVCGNCLFQAFERVRACED